MASRGCGVWINRDRFGKDDNRGWFGAVPSDGRGLGGDQGPDARNRSAHTLVIQGQDLPGKGGKHHASRHKKRSFRRALLLYPSILRCCRLLDPLWVSVGFTASRSFLPT